MKQVIVIIIIIIIHIPNCICNWSGSIQCQLSSSKLATLPQIPPVLTMMRIMMTVTLLDIFELNSKTKRPLDFYWCQKKQGLLTRSEKEIPFFNCFIINPFFVCIKPPFFVSINILVGVADIHLASSASFLLKSTDMFSAFI